ncbi:MAG TPA: flagellar biosynthesis protein FlhB [Accumulibacter sp.]|uniref:Flagellar biosynthetic protein FlhB n=2 Tax=Candidatus Accumulibacter TaxID=327159 RepID=A0A7D5SH16_9PROT|nr:MULTISPECIES: flagellar biosynthesis protein FlhB [Candidatus Accumulibacter]QLH51624.1 MAG: flagellar type III secretion system protein FlhB [Candidatus Accumulibacter cognatus]MBL8402614.1 flagellar type III secretion system protein FlhB [Accumulibacter sp.]MCM8580655.1 flagellar biosynthesis protein FlhB [Accumulibacter sp.]MCM8623358.1 flagellar biosynthesis protein FlhB [Accumulibacter sp.]MCQ1551441.1 flagellar biosynthesis protein FlhB [Candidatus Accumulibacter phosphatis]
MAEESDLEKTEPASARRLEQAREEGQVPRSREVGAFVILIVAATAFWLMGPWVMQRLAEIFRRGMWVDSRLAREPTMMLVRLAEISLDALLIFVPLFAALVAATLLSPFFLGSWNFSMKALQPELSRLDPLKGMARLVSWSGLVELVKAVAKASLLGGVAVWILWSERGDLLAMFAQSLPVSLSSAGHLLTFSFFAIVAAMLLIVVVDVPFQIWQHHDKLKMTREELKQEGKELEGNPEVKGRIRQLQREAARKRMMAAVPAADVIVTNPTHYAVALAYKSGMVAPKVLAKGVGEIALKIRQVGAENSVPIIEAAPLARALYRHVDLDQEIPATLYAAVAEVLAYIYQLSNWRQTGGNYPMPTLAMTVPDELIGETANG